MTKNIHQSLEIVKTQWWIESRIEVSIWRSDTVTVSGLTAVATWLAGLAEEARLLEYERVVAIWFFQKATRPNSGTVQLGWFTVSNGSLQQYRKWYFYLASKRNPQGALNFRKLLQSINFVDNFVYKLSIRDSNLELLSERERSTCLSNVDSFASTSRISILSLRFFGFPFGLVRKNGSQRERINKINCFFWPQRDRWVCIVLYCFLLGCGYYATALPRP